jgi:hypothetical protein
MGLAHGSKVANGTAETTSLRGVDLACKVGE